MEMGTELAEVGIDMGPALAAMPTPKISFDVLRPPLVRRAPGLLQALPPGGLATGTAEPLLSDSDPASSSQLSSLNDVASVETLEDSESWRRRRCPSLVLDALSGEGGKPTT